MCPSYMATREEEHATRGRANALVKALSSPDPKAALGDERLHEILDLCLECKACKSECPLSVDMATLKAEFLSHYQDVARRARCARACSARSARSTGSARRPRRCRTCPPACRRCARCSSARPGIDRPRARCRASRARRCVRWHRAPGAARRAGADRGEVVFLADSFTTFTEPGVGRAAIELLEAAGWRVRLESGGCCGRASISKGLLDQARGMAADMVGRLAPYAERGVPIVGCEPSCLLTLARGAPRACCPDDPRAAAVGRQRAARGRAAGRGDRRRRRCGSTRPRR